VQRALLDFAWLMVYAVRMALAIERAHPSLRPLVLAARALSWLCAGTLLVACSTNGDDDDNDTGSANATIKDENNYTSVTELSIDTVEVAGDDDSVQVCWDQVTSDLLCHEVDPESDLDHVSLIRFKNKTESDIEELFGSGELDTKRDIDRYVEYKITDPQKTCAKLSSMQDIAGNPISFEDVFVASDEFTYVLLVAEGDMAGVGTRSMTFVKPTSSSDTTTVEIPPGCSDAGNILSKYTATLKSDNEVSIPADGPWVVDWSQVKHDGTGNEIGAGSIDSLLLGFYEGMTVDEIESQIKDLEIVATTLWEVDTKGTSADLADARERTASGKAGDRFSGFTSTDGVWLLGLMCSGCQSPAPVVLAVLDPQSGA
jgi:hypothetical protein